MFTIFRQLKIFTVLHTSDVSGLNFLGLGLQFFPTGGPGLGLHFNYRARAGLGLTIFQTRAGFRALGLFQIALNLLNLKYKQEKP